MIADKSRLYATVEELERPAISVRRNGLTYDLVTPPFLASSHIDRERTPQLCWLRAPNAIAISKRFNTYIKNCAAAGIPAIKYNMSILGVLRIGRVPGRGDSTYSPMGPLHRPTRRHLSPERDM